METTLESTISALDGDRELVRQARAGSRTAFDALFQHHKPFIYNVCYRMLGSSEDAVDATQAAFIQAYQSIRRFRQECAFRSWVYRIAVNVCTSMVRREQRRRQLALSAQTPPEGRESGDQVCDTVLTLAPDLRAVLVLFYFQDLSCKETAEALGCSEGAVRARLHRARIAFKRQYGELEE